MLSEDIYMLCPEHISADDVLFKKLPRQVLWIEAALLQRIESFFIGKDGVGIADELEAAAFAREIEDIKAVIKRLAVVELLFAPHCRDTLAAALLRRDKGGIVRYPDMYHRVDIAGFFACAAYHGADDLHIAVGHEIVGNFLHKDVLSEHTVLFGGVACERVSINISAFPAAFFIALFAEFFLFGLFAADLFFKRTQYLSACVAQLL